MQGKEFVLLHLRLHGESCTDACLSPELLFYQRACSPHTLVPQVRHCAKQSVPALGYKSCCSPLAVGQGQGAKFLAMVQCADSGLTPGLGSAFLPPLPGDSGGL